MSADRAFRGYKPRAINDPVLDLWQFGFRDTQIAVVLGLTRIIVKSAVRSGRNRRDPRAKRRRPARGHAHA